MRSLRSVQTVGNIDVILLGEGRAPLPSYATHFHFMPANSQQRHRWIAFRRRYPQWPCIHVFALVQMEKVRIMPEQPFGD